MSAIAYRFIEPLDVLFLRGNKLFGDPGSHGESLIPPWPSVAAGAIRSRMLADDGIDLAAFAKGQIEHPTLGTPDNPKDFAVTHFHLARRTDSGIEILVAPPADLVISKTEAGTPDVHSLAPFPVAAGVACSSPLPLLPVLAEKERSKPASGYWLKQSGWEKYLRGETPTADDLTASSDLWQIDPRVGVGLDADKRCASDGKLFSVQAVAMVKQGHRIGTNKETNKPSVADYDIGFLAGVTGAEPPADGLLRLGGDGRAAAIHTVSCALPEPDYEAITQARRCRLVLTTPGLFSGGWLPTGADSEGRFDLHDVRGRLVCAAVPRAEVISGWDLATNRPKPAQRVAPTGSVWWLDDLDATPEALRKLAASGLWRKEEQNSSRRAEGFNRFTFAAY